MDDSQCFQQGSSDIMCRAKVPRTVQGSSTPTYDNEEEEYKVEEVWKHRTQGQRTQYLIHWKGYGDEHVQ